MVMVKGYDKISLDYGMLLDLRFREATGTVTRDLAKVHHSDVDLAGTIPAWAQWPLSNLTIMNFNGAGDYMELAAADSLDLDFTTDDYSVACWINPLATGQSLMVAAKYTLDVDGWEIYHYTSGANEYLTLRHNHGSLAPAPTRTACYSDGWEQSTWWLMVITRSGLYPLHYQNGVALDMTYSAGGVQNPDSSAARDLVIGCRSTKDADWFQQYMWGLRIWDRELSALETWKMFEMERDLFGV